MDFELVLVQSYGSEWRCVASMGSNLRHGDVASWTTHIAH